MCVGPPLQVGYAQSVAVILPMYEPDAHLCIPFCRGCLFLAPLMEEGRLPVCVQPHLFFVFGIGEQNAI